MRILLIQLRRLGDLILTTPAILALRHQFPEVRVTLAIAKESEPLLPAIGGIDDSFIVTRGVRDLALSKKLRGFDCVIDFTQNARSAWMSLASGARQRIASHQWKRKRRLRARFYNEFVPCAMKEMHTIDYNLALLEPLGIAGASAQPKLEIPRKAQDQAGVLIRNELSDRPFAIFHPGSTRAEKFWEPMRWADVIAFAKNQLDLHPVLSSGNSALERKHATEIRSHLTVPIFDFTDRLDLLTLAALIARARFLVTVCKASGSSPLTAPKRKPRARPRIKRHLYGRT